MFFFLLKVNFPSKKVGKNGINSNESSLNCLLVLRMTTYTGVLGNQIYALKQAFLSLRTELATALAPIITKIVEFLRDKVIPKVKELIAKWKEMSSGLKVVIGVIGGVLTALGPVLSIVAKVIGLVGKLKEAVSALGGATKSCFIICFVCIITHLPNY